MNIWIRENMSFFLLPDLFQKVVNFFLFIIYIQACEKLLFISIPLVSWQNHNKMLSCVVRSTSPLELFPWLIMWFIWLYILDKRILSYQLMGWAFGGPAFQILLYKLLIGMM